MASGAPPNAATKREKGNKSNKKVSNKSRNKERKKTKKSNKKVSNKPQNKKKKKTTKNERKTKIKTNKGKKSNKKIANKPQKKERKKTKKNEKKKRTKKKIKKAKIQCIAKTLANNQCSRSAKGENKICGIHINKQARDQNKSRNSSPGQPAQRNVVSARVPILPMEKDQKKLANITLPINWHSDQKNSVYKYFQSTYNEDNKMEITTLFVLVLNLPAPYHIGSISKKRVVAQAFYSILLEGTENDEDKVQKSTWRPFDALVEDDIPKGTKEEPSWDIKIHKSKFDKLDGFGSVTLMQMSALLGGGIWDTEVGEKKRQMFGLYPLKKEEEIRQLNDPLPVLFREHTESTLKTTENEINEIIGDANSYGIRLSECIVDGRFFETYLTCGKCKPNLASVVAERITNPGLSFLAYLEKFGSKKYQDCFKEKSTKKKEIKTKKNEKHQQNRRGKKNGDQHDSDSNSNSNSETDSDKELQNRGDRSAPKGKKK